MYIYRASIDYILVYDFEATCCADRKEIPYNEIIEFPVVIVDVKTNFIKSIFHTYVRPADYPQLTKFCTELTGIQ